MIYKDVPVKTIIKKAYFISPKIPVSFSASTPTQAYTHNIIQPDFPPPPKMYPLKFIKHDIIQSNKTRLCILCNFYTITDGKSLRLHTS